MTARMVAERARSYFLAEGREFPWRAARNPFHLAIAEILLQRTRAQSVIPTYSAMIARYPTPSALGGASLLELETALLPLGLSKKRARQLVGMGAAARDLGETIFGDWRALLTDVPGLGAYAARAIACFGGGEPVGIVDANIARILRRVFRIRTTDPRAAAYQCHADEVAVAAVDPRATNFGLLDVGAVVCAPRPMCDRCPFADFCPRYGV